MKCTILCLALAAFGAATVRAADNSHNHAPSAATNAAFEKMKTLVGTWVTADENGNPTDEVASVIKLTAGGSALQETLFPGQPLEMVSVYTADGNDVFMTHYCMLGNQPQLRGTEKSPNTLVFEFVGGANLDPAKDQHMHGAVLKIIDADHIEVEGTGWEDGKPAQEMCGVLKLVRQK